MKIKDSDFFLVQFTGRESETLYGPFESKCRAWRYLFARNPTPEEVEQHELARWSVRPAVAQEE